MTRTERNRRREYTLGAAVVIAATSLLVLLRERVMRGGRAGPPPAATVFVGSQRCAECHARETARWSGSHHALAMRVAADSTVAGNFANARYTYAGVTTTFSRRNGRFVLRTDGPDGAMHDYDVKYTFGVDPLQQYLIELPRGRMQAFSIAWDTRPKAAGGQRWFHLYPGQRIDHSDELHWTGLRQNWNYMCAECHSTGVKKNYNASTRTFATTFAAVNVGCEGCHGAGSEHVQSQGRSRLPAFTHANEAERCARCHSRREQFADGDTAGAPLGDTHRVSLLDDRLYYADGQIRDEVFEYGSFLQSRMHAQGVSCSDCHDPHTATLRASRRGNQVCARCHASEKYDAPSHHFHARASAGSGCVSCHMPTTTYMQVDDRHDHSIRVPRPDLSVSLGVPNACTKCHSDRSATWAARQVNAWYGHTPRGYQQYAEAYAAAARGDSGAPRLLGAVVRDLNQPAIARASALQRLAPFVPGSESPGLDIIRSGLFDADALVRRAAISALGESNADARMRARSLGPLLRDSVRDVRVEAARVLAPLAPVDVSEAIAAEEFNADRPESRLNLSLLYLALNRTGDAERELRSALVIDPRFVSGLVNLADVYRTMGQEGEAERALRSAISVDSGNAAAHHALGLLLVRGKRSSESLSEFAAAADLAPDVARYGTVYALALDAAGRRARATDVLLRVVARHPFDRDALTLLLAHLRERGDSARALVYARRLEALEGQ